VIFEKWIETSSHGPITVSSPASESARSASDGRRTTPADLALGDAVGAVVVDELCEVRVIKTGETRIRQMIITL
jgi:hypothetical protein